MPAYFVFDLTVRDAAAIKTHRRRAAASIAQFGGRYFARGRERSRTNGRRDRS
jgi:uncharacterized protein (DUF1330 family)